MIVLSTVLVLVALALLVVGSVLGQGALVYASIVAAVASGVLLVLGLVLRRRDEVDDGTGLDALGRDDETAPPAQPGAPGGPESPYAVAPHDDDVVPSPLRDDPQPRGAGGTDQDDDGDGAGGAPVDEDTEGYVLVVPGRPRYHADGCRHVAGREVVEVPVEAARDDGYRGCQVCRPDELLAAAARGAGPEEDPDPGPGPAPDGTEPSSALPGELPAGSDPSPVEDVVERPRARRAGSRRLSGDDGEVPDRPLDRSARVLALRARGRYHRPGCRYVRDNPAVEDLAKATARRQGLEPCGVCRP